jgi:DNA-binding response OmpR family regulator
MTRAAIHSVMPSPAVEIERLQNRVAELEELLGITYPIPPALGFTQRESVYLGMLLKRPLLTREAVMIVVYPDCDRSDKIVDQHIMKLRRKFGPHGIAITTRWGYGWYLDRENRRKLEELIAWHRQVSS